jgi:hypothetical protein
VLGASKKFGLYEIVERTKHMVVSRDQHAGKNHNIKIGDKSFERVKHFKYLEKKKILKNQNFIHEGIKSRLKSANAFSLML